MFRSDNGSYGTACRCQTNHHFITPCDTILLLFSHICIGLLLQHYSTTRHVVVYQQQAFNNFEFYSILLVCLAFFNNTSVFLLFPFMSPPSLPLQLTAQRPSGLSSQSGSDSVPQCLLLERRGEAEAEAQQVLEHTADILSPQEHVPAHPESSTDPAAEALVNGNSPTRAQSPVVPSRVSSPRSPHSPPPRSPSSPRSPRSPVFANGHLSPPPNSQRDSISGSFPKVRDPGNGHEHAVCATEPPPNGEESKEENQAPDQTSGPAPSSPAAPRKDLSRRQSRIPVLEPSSLLDLPPPGSAKEKLLQKKASHQGSVPSPTASPSLSDRRGHIVASLAKDPLSSTSDRSQEEDSLMGSRSDRQGDDAPSLSSSSSPLSRKSRIPRPVHSASSAEQLAAQYLPRPPPGKPPCRPTAESR